MFNTKFRVSFHLIGVGRGDRGGLWQRRVVTKPISRNLWPLARWQRRTVVSWETRYLTQYVPQAYGKRLHEYEICMEKIPKSKFFIKILIVIISWHITFTWLWFFLVYCVVFEVSKRGIVFLCLHLVLKLRIIILTRSQFSAPRRVVTRCHNSPHSHSFKFVCNLNAFWSYI